MGKEKTKDTKQKIFDAAVTLFARKGFAAVGIREIAKEANVNTSMIHYYYDGKIAILKNIINEAYDKYQQAMVDSGDENTSSEERIRTIIKNLIDYFRTHTGIAMVAFNIQPFNIPEVIDLKMEWATANTKRMRNLCRQLGIDLQDEVQTNLFSGLLRTMVLKHFQSKYVWDQILQSPDKPKKVEQCLKEECSVECNDSYYERYTDMLTKWYFEGLKGLTEMKNKERRQK